MCETGSNFLDTIDPDANHFVDNSVSYSSYYMEDFYKSNITINESLNIFHNNARSILSDGRMDDYKDLLGYINNPFHILAFTETWLRPDNVDRVFFEGFDKCHLLRPIDNQFNFKESGGGISIFIKESINYKVRDDLNVLSPHLEALFIEVNHNNKLYLVGVTYRIPDTNVNSFNETINAIIEPIKNNYEIILLGDFNICLLKDNNHTNNFRNSLISNNLFPTILEPTRVATVNRNGQRVTTESLIDNIFINTQLDFKSGLIYSSISDHYPVFISIHHSTNQQTEENCAIKYRVIDEFTIRKFKFALLISLNSLLNDATDPQTAFTKFYLLLDELYNKYFPIKTKSVSKKAQQKPWINQTLVNRIKIKDKLCRQSSKGRIDRKTYTDFRNKLTAQIRKAKASYFENRFNMCKGNIKETWNTINSTIKKQKVSNQVVIYENDNIVHNNDVPHKFIEYYSNIANTIVSEIPIVNENVESYLGDANASSFFMCPIINQEVENAIRDLNDNGCGIFKIATSVLKEVKSTISNTLSIIYNMCIEHGYFPEELKIGCITPVYKKGDKSNISSYRPICSLSSFSKIFEKIVYNRMLNFIEKHEILSKSQFGFRKNVSTETALANFIDYVHKGLTAKHNVGAIFMDLSRAFDVMDHNILEIKLKHYGFRGTFLKFLMSFVRNRKYFVNINGMNSHTRTVNIGVPQGSTLGPLLFLLYINDMKNCSSILQFTQFADDTTSTYSCKNLLDLQQTLEREILKVTHWLAANKLILNLTKTHCMLFTFKRKQQNLAIQINNTYIEEKTVTSFLGVQIDNKLNWKAHIAHICNKVSKAIAILRFVRYYYPNNILKMIYMSLIYSHINYCNLIWGAAEVGIIEPLFILQKKSIRIITKSPYLEHTTPLFESLKLLTVYQVYTLNCSLFMYKCLKFNYCPNFKTMIHRNSNYYDYNTRHRNLFRISQRIRLRICQRSFLNTGINIWNSLDPEMKTINSIPLFKSKMKMLLIPIS